MALVGPGLSWGGLLIKMLSSLATSVVVDCNSALEGRVWESPTSCAGLVHGYSTHEA